MRVCLNDGCRYFVRLSARAEYRDDILTCSDCGGALVAAVEPKAIPKEPTNAPMSRLWVTGGLVLCVWALGQVMLPGVEVEVLTDYLSQSSGLFGLRALFGRLHLEQVSVFALGPEPIETASALVGLAVMLVPTWRRQLIDGARRRFLQPIVIGSVLVAAIQAQSVATHLRALRVGARFVVDEEASTAPIIAVLMLGVLLAAVIAQGITRYGIGNGFAWLAILPIVPSLLSFLAALPGVNDGERSPAVVAGGTLVLMGGVAFAAFQSLTIRVGRKSLVFAEFGSAGATTGSLVFASAILVLPSTLSGVWPDLRSASETLMSNRRAYLALYGSLAAGLAWFMTVRSVPFERLQVLGSRLGLTATPGDRAALVLAHQSRALVVIAAVIAASVVQDEARLLSFPITLGTVIALTAWVLDLVAEWQFRSKFKDLERIWSLHEQVALGAIHEALGRADIPVLAKSWRFRSLFQFLAPNVEVEILVPADRAAEATQILTTLLAPAPAITATA